MTGSSTTDVPRVALRPLLPADNADVDPWLQDAMAAVDGVKPSADTPASLAALGPHVNARWPGATVEAVIVEASVAGLLVWRPARPRPRVSQPAFAIEALTVRAGLRNRGYGAEAVYCLEAAHPGARVKAAVPRFNGLAIYFWLRVGYRPVRIDEDAALAQDPDRLWMINALNLGPSGASSVR